MYNNNLPLENYSSDAKIKIALVDDHPVARHGLAKIINEYERYEVVIQANNGAHFIEELKVSSLPDIVLLDVRMPVMDGFATAQWLKNNYPDVAVIILTGFNPELMIRGAVRYGVRAFLSKEAEPYEFKRMLDEVVINGSDNLVNKMIRLFEQMDEKEVEKKAPIGRKGVKLSGNPVLFSKNELEFLQSITTELTYGQIAVKMNVSIRTVENYVEAICNKLGLANNRLVLAVFAVNNGIGYF